MHTTTLLPSLFSLLLMCTVFSSPVFAWKPIKGIVTPLATPLSSQDTLDEPSTIALLNHVIQGGVSGIFLLGTTGEGPSLSHATRRKFVQFCCRHCRCSTLDIPILVSVTDTSFTETIELAQIAQESGATAIVLAPPYYFTMSQHELINYTEAILKETELPILLYNIPFLTKTQWDVDTVLTLTQRHPNRIFGMKDSSGDMEYFTKLCRVLKEEHNPNFNVLMGPEHLLPEAIQVGADGGVNGGSNVVPDLFVSLYRELVESDNDNNSKQQLNSLVQKLKDFQQIYNLDDTPFSRFVTGTKCSLVAMGVIDFAYVNLPFTPPNGYKNIISKAKAVIEEL